MASKFHVRPTDTSPSHDPTLPGEPGTALHHRFRGAPWTRSLIPHSGLTEPLRHNAGFQPNAPFLTEISGGAEGSTFTYAQIWDDTARTAAFLRRHFGVGLGDRVAIAPVNAADSVIVILAVSLLGAVTVLINPRDPVDRRREQISASGSGLVLAGEPDIGIPCESVADLVEAARRGPSSLEEPGFPAADPLRPALILFTTGSTAGAKAVVLTHHNVLTNSGALAKLHGLRRGRRLYGVLPISYANGLGLSVIATMIGGGHLILAARFDPFDYLTGVSKTRAHVASLVPGMLSTLALGRARPDLSDLDYFISAAAPLPTRTAEAILTRLDKRVVQGYGLTETTNFSTSMPPHTSERAYRRWMLDAEIPSVGVPLSGNEVAVLDEGGRPLSPGSVGEVCMRGHNVMLHYDKNPEANAEAFAHGWFHSGDLGFTTLDDESGEAFLTLVGRIKNIAKIGGAAVSLEEVDRVLHSIEGVQDAVAMSVPDDNTGERIAIRVVPTTSGAVDRPTIQAALRQRLPAAVASESIEFVDELTRTGNGKVVRR